MKKIFFILVVVYICIAGPPGPLATFVVPRDLDDQWAGCEFQEISIALIDPDGINTSTILFEFDGELMTWPDPRLSIEDDTLLIFIPASPLTNGTLYDYTLHAVDDNDGYPLQFSPVSNSFSTDFDNPYFLPDTRFPIPDSTIRSRFFDVSVIVSDSTSGIVPVGLCLCIESADYHQCGGSRGSGYCWNPGIIGGITYDGTTFVVEDDVTNFRHDEDSVMICLRMALDHVPDNPAYCGPNWIDTLDPELCWDFVVDMIYPTAELIYPLAGDTTACDSLIFRITDFSPVDTAYTRLNFIGGPNYNLGLSSNFNVGADGLYYFSGTGTSAFHDGLNSFKIDRLRDVYGNEVITGAPTWNVFLDKTPPVASSPSPPDGGVVTVASPNISIQVVDAATHVTPSSLSMSVNGIPYGYSHPATSWSTDRFRLNTGAAGLSFEDGDTVSVCLTSADDGVSPEKCGPNSMTRPYCFQFYIDRGGPSAYVYSPYFDAWSACPYQKIKWIVSDIIGVTPSTISVNVEGILYDYPDHLTLRGDTIIFTPTTPFSDGDVVNHILLSVDDVYGNHLTSTVSSRFTIDMTPPVISTISPPSGTFIGGGTMDFDIAVSDAGAGVAAAGATISFRTYESSTGFSWDGSSFSYTIDMASTGLVFMDNETLDVCFEIADLVAEAFCGPNIGDSCTQIIIDMSPPSVEMVYPEDSIITACTSGPFRFLFSDQNGLDVSALSISVDGITYPYPSSTLTVHGDTVVFTPSTPFSHGDVLNIHWIDFADTMGNHMDTSPDWTVFIDTECPVVSAHSPEDGDTVADPSPVIRFTIIDGPADFNPDSFAITVDGTPFTFAHPSVTYSGGQFFFDALTAGLVFDDGDDATICVTRLADDILPENCGPNACDPGYCFEIHFDLQGPNAELLLPETGAYSSCSFPSQSIRILITDSDGVNHPATIIGVNGLPHPSGDWSMHDDTLVFMPVTPFFDGDTVELTLIEAYDLLGNPSTDIDLGFFIFDFSEPYLVANYPADGEFLSLPVPDFTMTIRDDLSGIDVTTYNITINGTSYGWGSSGITLDDDVFSIDLSDLGIYPGDGDTIEYCLESIADRAQYCGSNDFSPGTCWEVYFDLSAPVVELVQPDSGEITACAGSSIKVRVLDNFGLFPDSLQLRVDGTTYILSNPELSFHGDTLVFVPSTPWSHGDTIVFKVRRAVDLAGNVSSGLPTWFYIIDTEPPVIGDITSGIITDSIPAFSLELFDDPAGVDPGSITLDYGGIPLTTASPGVTWSSPVLNIEPEIVVHDDSLTVCVSADDLVVQCGPNHLADSCFYFVLDLNGPFCEAIMPLGGEITACPEQQIVIRIIDDYGVSLPELRLSVDGTVYTISATELSYIGDSLLIFIPESPFPEENINVILYDVIDFNGNEGDSLNYSFIVDLTPPEITALSPAPFESVPSTHSIFSIDIYDAISDVDGITVTMSGMTFSPGDGCTSYDGSEIRINPRLCGFDIDDGDVIDICVHAHDTPDYCIPNAVDSCYSVYVNDGGPVAAIVEPINGSITACPSQQIILELTDPTGLNLSSIELDVNGTTYRISDPELAMIGDQLTFTPSVPFSDGETVDVSFTEANDILGLGLETPLVWSFIVDLSPPVIYSITPPPGSAFTAADTDVEIVLVDSISGVNVVPLSFSVAAYGFTPDEIYYSGDTARFTFSEIGFVPASGESTRVCIRNLMDMPDYCLPNELADRYCFKYYFDFNGPEANMYVPGDSSITSCMSCSLYFYINDYTEVDPATIVLDIGGMDYTTASPEVSYDGYTLIFNPDFEWPEGEYIPVVVESADDVFGNPLQGAPRIFAFGIDTTAPVVVPVEPLAGETVYSYSPTVRMILSDNFSGVFHGMFSIRINGTRYTLSDPGMSLTDSILVLDLDAAGVVLPSGSTSVCIDSVFDSAIFCGPNMAERQCFSFFVSEDDGGPDAWMRTPVEGSYSSCVYDSIILVMRDTDGINWPTLEVDINGYIHRYGSGGVTVLSDSSVLLIPSVASVDGDTVFVTLEGITDSIDNLTSYDTPWFYITDQTPPDAVLISPLPGTVFNGTGTVEYSFSDDGAGLDPTSVYVTVNSDSIDAFHLTGGSLDIDIAELDFDPVDTLELCVHASDLTEYCGSNVMEPYCETFYIDILPPTIEFVYPELGDFTSCAYQEIRFSALDDWSVDPSSVELAINGTGIPAGLLAFDTDMFAYTPGTSYSSGDTVRASVTAIADTIGNELAESDSITTWFVVDLDPPEHGPEFPADWSVTADIHQPVEIEVNDSLSGVDPASISLILDGTEYTLASSGLSYSSGIVRFDPEAEALAFSDGDTVFWCIHALDLASAYCPANSMDTACFSFTVNTSGPRASIVSPLNRSYYACPPESAEVIMEIADEDGIIPESIRFYVNDSLAELGTDLFYEPPYLIYRPEDMWGSSGIVRCVLSSVTDSLENPLGVPLSWFFYLDRVPPYVTEFYPTSGEVMPDIPGRIWARLTDDLSGLNRGSVEVTVDGMPYTPIFRADTFMVYAESLLTTPSDSMRFCIIYAEDNPDYCGPNVMDTVCNTFIVPAAEFGARVLSPRCGSFLSCDSTSIRVLLTYEIALDESSILFAVAGDTIDIASPTLHLSGDTLIYEPSGSWADGDTVRFSLVAASDVEGHTLSAPVGCSFYVDRTAPVIDDFSPVDMSTSGATTEISFFLRDSLSGINPSALIVVLDGDTFHYWDIDYSSGIVTLDLDDLGHLPGDGDTVHLEIFAADNATMCGANSTSADFEYYFDLNPPVVELRYPVDSAVTSCSDSGFVFFVNDINGISDSLLLSIDGVSYSISSPEIILVDSIVRFVPALPYTDGDTLRFAVTYVSDSLGNSTSTREYLIAYDTEPPFVAHHSPLDGVIIGRVEPIVSILVSDAVSGVDLSSIRVTGPTGSGDPLTLSGWSFAGDTLIWDAATAGLIYDTGDSLTFCVFDAIDMPDFCPSNMMEEYCFSFMVNADGPIVTYISPADSSYISCPDLPVVTLLSDPDGILWDSLYFEFNETTYGIVDVTHDDSIFTFIPPSGLEHGDTIRFSVQTAPDSLHHELLFVDTLVWFIDVMPPEVVFIVPEPSIIISDTFPVICIGLFDDMSGIDSTGIWVTINDSREVYLSEPELIFDGFELCFYAESTMIAYHEGDSLRLCLHSIDSPDTCDPNVLDTCFTIYFGDTGPLATQIYPEENIYTSCLGGYAAILFEDEDGLFYDSLGVVVHGDTLLLIDDHSELELRGDTLFFMGSITLPPGDSIPLLPFGRDMLLNDMRNDLVIYLVTDTIPPTLVGFAPLTTYNPLAEITAVIVDDLSGLDSMYFAIRTSFMDSIYGVTGFSGDSFFLSPEILNSADAWYSGADDSLLFLHELDTVRVTTYFSDRAGYCGSNADSASFSFPVTDDDTTGPEIWPVGLPYAVVAGRSLEIRFISTDISGVDSARIIFDASGEITPISISAPMLPVAGDTFSATIGPFNWGDSAVFCGLTWDGDYDFDRMTDISMAVSDTFPIQILADIPPVILPIDAGGISSCRDGYVRVLITDDEGVNRESIVISIGTNVYSGTELEFDGDTALVPLPDVEHGDSIKVRVIEVEDVLGNSIEEPVEWSFFFDLQPPTLYVVSPESTVITEEIDVIQIEIIDDLSAVNYDSLMIYINGMLEPTPYNIVGDIIQLPVPAIYGSLYVEIVNLMDTAGYCGNNVAEDTTLVFLIPGNFVCETEPDVFTPNGDDYNPVVRFIYPKMDLDPSAINIYDAKARHVREIKVVNAFPETGDAFWDGNDRDGNPASPGLYVYTITSEGKVLCRGTIVLAR